MDFFIITTKQSLQDSATSLIGESWRSIDRGPDALNLHVVLYKQCHIELLCFMTSWWAPVIHCDPFLQSRSSSAYCIPSATCALLKWETGRWSMIYPNCAENCMCRMSGLQEYLRCIKGQWPCLDVLSTCQHPITPPPASNYSLSLYFFFFLRQQILFFCVKTMMKSYIMHVG